MADINLTANIKSNKAPVLLTITIASDDPIRRKKANTAFKIGHALDLFLDSVRVLF